MPDISLCTNKECPIKDKCYRANAEPHPYRQSYHLYKFKKNEEGEVSCDDFRLWRDRDKVNRKAVEKLKEIVKKS